MIKDIILPKLSGLMQTGSIVKINVTDGQYVKKGQAIFELEAEKVNTEIESPMDGYIKLQCKEGEELEVGTILALVSTYLEELEIEEQKDKQFSKNRANFESSGGKTFDKEEIQIKKIEGIKKVMFEHMEKAKEYVHATTFMEVDMKKIKDIRRQHKYSYTSFITYAVINALKNHLLINSTYDSGEIHISKHINVGIALDNKGDLIVPVLKQADNMTVEEIENRIRQFEEKAKSGSIKIEDLSEGTFTITNSGVFGSYFFAPVINYPQSAILGIGQIKDMPVVIDEEIVIRPIVIFSLSYDHRIIEGSLAVNFLSQVRKNLEFFEI